MESFVPRTGSGAKPGNRHGRRRDQGRDVSGDRTAREDRSLDVAGPAWKIDQDVQVGGCRSRGHGGAGQAQADFQLDCAGSPDDPVAGEPGDEEYGFIDRRPVARVLENEGIS